jgi:NADH dehydrogenase
MGDTKEHSFLETLMKKVLIIGGGFGGIRTALALEKRRIPDLKIILVSDRTNFEYHATLYRIVTGRSPLEACIPLRDIFAGKDIEAVEDTVEAVDLGGKTARGTSGSSYAFDFLVLALGSETSYFGVSGLEEYSFGFKSIDEAIRLRDHIEKMFADCAGTGDATHKLCALHFAIVGGGMSGVELAGELAPHTRKLAEKYGVSPSFVTVDLMEAAPRILPGLPESVSKEAEKRLRDLHVNVYPNRAILEEKTDEALFTDMRAKTKTVIWTAGVRPHRLHSRIGGLTCERNGKVIVDAFLRPAGYGNVFVIGDAASTKFSGMAQTAISDGRSVASNIERTLLGKPLTPYTTERPLSLLPIGSGWAIALIGGFHVSGLIGWWLRRAFDFFVFLLHLPLRRSIDIFRDAD